MPRAPAIMPMVVLCRCSSEAAWVAYVASWPVPGARCVGTTWSTSKPHPLVRFTHRARNAGPLVQEFALVGSISGGTGYSVSLQHKRKQRMVTSPP